MSAFRHRLASFLRAEDGGTVVELVLLLPIFVVILLSAFESGLMNVRVALLERATDLAVRDIRLSTGNAPDHDGLKQAVCDYAGMIPGCRDAIQIELRPVETDNWAALDGPAQCIDRDSEIDPVINFTHGGQNEMMMVRVCVVLDPWFPTIGLGRALPKDSTGGYRVTATSAFVNEPVGG